ncbi:MAG: alkaline phosphatase [Dehalococcoidales bacterium]|nr:alkaline phosphatase [Dehalococcoidales bacterium]
MKKKIIPILLCLALVTSIFSGCTSDKSAEKTSTSTSSPAKETVIEQKVPKYVFMMIGDGMSAVQVNAAQVINGNNTSGEVSTDNLLFANFPACGMATTHDSTSFCPDSASTATAMSTGYKTHSGVIGLAVDKTTVVKNLSEMFKEKGKKVGIISTVTINHATPAAYYAHMASRNDYYEIALQMAESGFDYFAGGEISKPTGNNKDQEDAYKIMEKNGYTIARTAAEIAKLNASTGKCYAVAPNIQDSGSMTYALDQNSGDVSLADLVKKCIEVLDNDNGFFIMAESGKIDWACHANDAMATIHEVIDFEAAVKVAYDFARQHPDETLIVVTGDHETGGMTIGFASTGYSTAFNVLSSQKMSYVEFDSLVADLKEANPNLDFAYVMTAVTKYFGLKLPSGNAEADKADPLVLTDYEVEKLEAAFEQSMTPSGERNKDQEYNLLYGGYDPLSVTLTHIINNKAGLGWTSYSHTGVPVPVYAWGPGEELFNGFYDNTDVFDKICDICEIN